MKNIIDSQNKILALPFRVDMSYGPIVRELIGCVVSAIAIGGIRKSNGKRPSLKDEGKFSRRK